MMRLEPLITSLSQRLLLPLPGAKAHEFLRARPSGSVIPNFTHKLPPKPGSVLILLYEEKGILKFPLIKRPEYLGAHSGQISLPGGKAEEGETTIETALREGEEEIGIDRRAVKVLGTLSDFFVIPSNFMVTPVIGYVDNEPAFKADNREVAGILRAELTDLLKPNAIREKEIIAAGKFSMLAPHFELDSEIVWGATAMMLNEFRMILSEV
jgi:8-oxo-dGTP pyrophosphatase MutT (NUDIX family)